MVRLATEDMTSLWKAATGALLHGPRCSCVGFGMMHRSRTELERDIAEFLIAKYEDSNELALALFFQRWVDEHAGASGRGRNAVGVPVRNESLPEWIDSHAAEMSMSDSDLNRIAADIRGLLQTMAGQASEFTCR